MSALRCTGEPLIHGIVEVILYFLEEVSHALVMDKDTDPKQKVTFSPVTDARDARALLVEASKTCAPTLIWTTDYEATFHSNLNCVNTSENFLSVLRPRHLNPKAFTQRMRGAPSQSCLFSVALSRANFFFKSDFVAAAPTGLQFKVPEKLFKVQRRKFLRHRIPEGYIMRVDFRDPHPPYGKVSMKVYDLTAEGLSFIVTDFSATSYHHGMLLQELAMTIKKKRIFSVGEVMNSRVLPRESREKGLRVGIRFAKMKDEDTRLISEYVDEEIQKYFAKLI